MANPRQANGHRRRQVRAAVLAEETNCGICGEWVDKTLGNMAGVHSPRCTDQACAGCVPDPMRAEVDEIVPIRFGGSPTERTNCRLSHRRCNQARNRKRGQPMQQAVNREPYRTSRDWVAGTPSPGIEGTFSA